MKAADETIGKAAEEIKEVIKVNKKKGETPTLIFKEKKVKRKPILFFNYVKRIN